MGCILSSSAEAIVFFRVEFIAPAHSSPCLTSLNVGPVGCFGSPGDLIYLMWQASFKSQSSTNPKQIFPASSPTYLNDLSLLGVMPSEMKAGKKGREEQEHLGVWERKAKIFPKLPFVVACL